MALYSLLQPAAGTSGDAPGGSAGGDLTGTYPNPTVAQASRGLPQALTGATAATRYVGGTTGGPPVSGTFAVGDFVIDQTGAVIVCTVAGTPGTWPIAATAAPSFQTLTSPPVSTTVYQNTTNRDLTASLRAVLAVNPVLASDCKVEISPDNFASAQVWADPGLAAGALAVANAPEYIEFPIPASWYYKVTATNTTIGALVAIG